MSRAHLRASSFLALLTLAAGGTTLAGAETNDPADLWSQWRGPSRNGVVEGAAWPNDLDTLEQVWKVQLGKGYPGPVLSSDTVFVVETVDGNTEQVRALDRDDGSEKWKFSWSGGMEVPFFARKNGSWVRSTPAYANGGLYVGGMQERFFKLDAETGEQLWSVDFPAEFDTKQPDFGFSSSPLVTEDAVYVQAANSLFRLDPLTGDIVWRSLANPGKITESGAFSSPVLLTLGAREQLVVQTRTTLYGIAPEDGSIFWSQDVPSYRGMNILTPVADGDRIFTSTHRNNSFLYSLDNTDDVFTVQETWKHKTHAYMSSPVIIDGHAYVHLGNRRVVCINLDSGEETWISEPFGEYWSMVAQGNKVLALDAAGSLYLINASPEKLDIIDEASIGDAPAWGYLAVSDDHIFVRELESIVAYRWPAKE